MISDDQERETPPNAKRVLVVEDELLIRMLMEDMLQDLGYTVTAAAGRIKEAMQEATSAAFDIAILDVNLNGESTGAVADAIAARGIPFAFVTGYGPHGLPEHHRARPILKKPFQLDGLKQTIEAALNAK